MDTPVLADQQRSIFINSVWTQDAVEDLIRVMDDKNGWWDRNKGIRVVSSTWW